MNRSVRRFAAALAALVLVAGSAAAGAQSRHGGGWGHSWHGSGYYWTPGLFWGGLGIGIGLGSLYAPYYAPYYAPAYPGYVVVEQPPTVYYGAPPVPVPPPAPVAVMLPEPVIYPRNGQSAEQTEADRRDCDRWATTQRNAMADASVFHRATLACMEGRGYTVR